MVTTELTPQAPVTCCSTLTGDPLSTEDAQEFARILKAIAEPARLRLVSLVAAHEGNEACVCDLSEVFDLTGPTISHHLKVLREAGLITGERRGTWVYYRVLPDALEGSVVVIEVEVVVVDDSQYGTASYELLDRVEGGLVRVSPRRRREFGFLCGERR